jgi:alpha-ribazole phosphatase
MELILVRHPAVAIEAGICYGQSDVPMAAPADTFAADLARRLAHVMAVEPHRIDTSPLSRCATVAALLADRYGLSVHEDADLKELDYGAWEMARWDTVGRTELDAWAADLEHGRPHGGESAAMLAARAERWLERAEAACGPSASIVAVTHAGVMRMLVSRLVGEPIAVSLARPLAYGAICRFVREPAEQGEAAATSPRAKAGPQANVVPKARAGADADVSHEIRAGPRANVVPKARAGADANVSHEARVSHEVKAGQWQLEDWNV